MNATELRVNVAAAMRAKIETLGDSWAADDTAHQVNESYDEGYSAALSDMEAELHRLVPPGAGKEKA